MSWRDQVNGGLSRLTGYELHKARSRAAQRPVAPRPAAPAAVAAPAAPAAPPAPKKLELPRDYDDAAQATIRAVKPWTMTSPEKLNALILSVRHTVKHDIPGDIGQSGVWAVATLDDVQAGMANVGYPEDRVHYVQGMVEQTVPDAAPDQIAIL